jgi:hypothetical protein
MMQIKNFLFVLWVVVFISPMVSISQELRQEGWSIPDFKGLTPYSITIQEVDGVEKIVEKFYTSNGGHVARLSGNGKVFGYAVDKDQEPPIDYLLIDSDGLGKFTQKFKSEESYLIPEWVSH